MGRAIPDNNGVRSLLATSNADGRTALRLRVDPSTHEIMVDDNTTGSDLGPAVAPRDNNEETAMIGTSSTDGSTPVALYMDSATSKLLIKST